MSNFLHLTGPFKKSMMGRRERSNQYAFLRMVLYIRENGSLMKIKRMVVESKFGQMDPGTTDFGRMEWPVATAVSSMQKVTFTKVHGKTTRRTGLVIILITTGVVTRDSGCKISNMARE